MERDGIVGGWDAAFSGWLTHADGRRIHVLGVFQDYPDAVLE